MVLFNFEEGSKTREIYNFPVENDWVELTTLITYKGGQNGPYQFDTSGRTAMFQKSGSIIPIQNATSIAEVIKNNLTLSVALKDNRASGYLLIEEGSEREFMKAAYSIEANGQVINFNVETLNPVIPKDYDNFIDQIIVSFVDGDKEINTACAIMRDMNTV
jgi:alpha-glucosidase (family GH31 glycosyl hydrolase)